MSPARSWALVVHELRILKHDPLPFALSVLLPLVMMSLLRTAFDAMFEARGGGDGTAQVVPGMAVLYATFLLANIAYGFLRELDWGTWTRLRMAGATTSEAVVSKLVPGFIVVLVLMESLFVAGSMLFDLQFEGSPVDLAVLLTIFSIWLTAAGAVIAAFCRTAAQATAIANLIALGCGGLSGLLVPAELLPTWAERAGHFLPTRAVMDGARHVIAGGGLGDLGFELVVLVLWAGVTTAAALRFLRSVVTVGHGR